MSVEKPAYSNMILYGIDITHFAGSDDDDTGDMKGIVDKMDYLSDLGVTHLWILPFYKSPRRDNGYDVTDYKSFDDKLGSLETFQKLVYSAHKHGIKIIIDMVLQHTSDQHPWFKSAVADKNSKHYKYYIWEKHPIQQPPSANNFPEDEPAGVWFYNKKAGEFYHHKFYHFQPDLDFANSDVREEMKSIMRFWQELGVDGFRIDAATHMFEVKGSQRKKLPIGESVKELHSYTPDMLFIGEVDLKPDKVGDYVGNNRLDTIFNFLMNNAMFLALATDSREPIYDCMRTLGEFCEAGRLLNFARNFDELDLEQLTKSERKLVMEKFAPKENMRLYGRGIRRQLAPMIGDKQQLQMIYSLLFSMPGSVMFTNGSELLIDEDLSKPDRKSVRIDVPWRNIEDPSKNLLSFFKELISVRKQYDVIGTKYPDLDEKLSEALAVFKYDDLLIIHNLSSKPSEHSINIDEHEILLGDISSNNIDRYGYCWLKRRA